jgi:predicted metal-dependent hydrolase
MAPMQLRLPWSTTQPEPVVRRRPPARQLIVSGEPVDLEIVRHRRARRYVVRVVDGGAVRLTVPRGASIAGGVRFAERQVEWVERERRRQRERAAPWRDGHAVWVRGEIAALRIEAGALIAGPEAIRPYDGRSDARALVEAHLRAAATKELPPRCLALAAETGLTVARVSVRNQRSRWGACSARGVITLNWRLIQMPASVSDYVIFHELCHLKQPNHSRRFWREVEAVCPSWRESERWLRKHGKDIL